MKKLLIISYLFFLAPTLVLAQEDFGDCEDWRIELTIMREGDNNSFTQIIAKPEGYSVDKIEVANGNITNDNYQVKYDSGKIIIYGNNNVFEALRTNGGDVTISIANNSKLSFVENGKKKCDFPVADNSYNKWFTECSNKVAIRRDTLKVREASNPSPSSSVSRRRRSKVIRGYRHAASSNRATGEFVILKNKRNYQVLISQGKSWQGKPSPWEGKYPSKEYDFIWHAVFHDGDTARFLVAKTLQGDRKYVLLDLGMPQGQKPLTPQEIDIAGKLSHLLGYKVCFSSIVSIKNNTARSLSLQTSSREFVSLLKGNQIYVACQELGKDRKKFYISLIHLLNPKAEPSMKILNSKNILWHAGSPFRNCN